MLPTLAGGGAERVILNLSCNLDRTRFTPSLLVIDSKGPLARDIPPELPFHSLERGRLRKGIMPLILELRRRAPGFVVSTLGYVNVALALCSALLPKECRLILREANTPSISLAGGGKNALIRGLYRLTYPRADLVLCPSELIRAELSRDFGIPPTKLKKLANPVDVAKVRAEDDPAIRPAGTGVHFVAAGRMTKQKGFERLLHSLAAMQDDSRLTLLGAGEMQVELELLAKELHVEDRVAFPGFVERPGRYFRGADAFLLPSRWEGMPNAALEALACGTPVIASRAAGGLPDLLDKAPAGTIRLVDPGDEFTAAMRDVTPDLTDGLRESFLPPEFALESVVKSFEELLEAVAISAA